MRCNAVQEQRRPIEYPRKRGTEFNPQPVRNLAHRVTFDVELLALCRRCRTGKEPNGHHGHGYPPIADIGRSGGVKSELLMP